MLLIALLALAQPNMVKCRAIDGDTLRCGKERVRLIGIDAPEKGRCPADRKCVKGDAAASEKALQKLVQQRPVRLERHGYDRYGRTLAIAYVGKVNLSCAQINHGYAVYVKKWDHDGRIGRCKRGRNSAHFADAAHV